MSRDDTQTADKPKHAGGRPSEYKQELADEICNRIADGESLRTIIKSDNMPDRMTVYRWLDSNKEFRDHYVNAREEQADTYVDEMEDIARDEALDVQRAKLILDTRKWVASKLKAKKYGDKIDMTTNGKDLPAPILGGATKQD